MNIPFGKYRGSKLTELPGHYIRWLLRQEWLEEPLAGALRDEFERRQRRAEEICQQRLLTGEVQKVATEIVKVGYKQMAMKFHPDSGGSHEGFLTLGQAKTLLDAYLRGVAA